MPFTPATAALATLEPREPGSLVILHASVVYDGVGLPRQDGAVLLRRGNAPDAHGGTYRIADVRDLKSTALAFPEAERVDAGFALSPPVVNAHTRISKSAPPRGEARGAEPALDLTRRSLRGEQSVEAARRGLRELAALGTPTIGDTVGDERVMRLLLGAEGFSGVAYWQVVEPEPSAATEAFERTVRLVTALREMERPGGVRVGVKLHAPYAVSAELTRLLARFTAAERLPLAIGVAATADELELSLHGRGRLAEALGAAGVDYAAPGVSPVRYLSDLGALAGSPTLLHGAHVSEDDVRLIARAGCAVVHCPRLNRAEGGGSFPWALYAKHSVEVAFGSGAGASSSELDVSEEVAAALELHGRAANPRALVRSAVKGGYRALRMRPLQALRGASEAALVLWR